MIYDAINFIFDRNDVLVLKYICRLDTKDHDVDHHDGNGVETIVTIGLL